MSFLSLLQATGDTSHSMVSGQAADPDSDPALRRAINHAIAEARRLKAAGDALQVIYVTVERAQSVQCI